MPRSSTPTGKQRSLAPVPGAGSTQADAILHFYQHLQPGFKMGHGISIMNPYLEPTAWSLASQFYKKFYGDADRRAYIFGINPGRFGAGVTGVPFTDPIRLAEKCGIANGFQKRGELSSEFVYAVIDAFGGPA